MKHDNEIRAFTHTQFPDFGSEILVRLAKPRLPATGNAITGAEFVDDIAGTVDVQKIA